MIVGVDEWFWTAYCLVDTYFGSESEYRDYLDKKALDPCSGGAKPLRFPVWNPREYFLLVLSRRIKQATREWTEVIRTFNEYLSAYVTPSLDKDNEPITNLAQEEKMLEELVIEDPELARTKELTLAVSTIRRLKDSLLGTIAAWDRFQNDQIHYFEVDWVSKILSEHWETYFAEIRSDIAQMDYLYLTLSQKLDAYNALGDRLVNASALRESSWATYQGENIRRLTVITVLYLPLSLATAVFSMSMFSESNRINWAYYAVVSVIAVSVTVLIAFNPRIIQSSLFRRWTK